MQPGDALSVAEKRYEAESRKADWFLQAIFFLSRQGWRVPLLNSEDET